MKYRSPIGDIFLAFDGGNLTQVSFENIVGATSENNAAENAKNWLDIYFSGGIPDFTPPICFTYGSTFAKRVWEILLEIPYGKTVTYGEIAKQIERERGRKVSAQAVGGAVGANPIAIIVPCHRVIGANGKLTGYAGGLDKKIKLLQIEKSLS